MFDASKISLNRFGAGCPAFASASKRPFGRSGDIFQEGLDFGLHAPATLAQALSEVALDARGIGLHDALKIPPTSRSTARWTLARVRSRSASQRIRLQPVSPHSSV